MPQDGWRKSYIPQDLRPDLIQEVGLLNPDGMRSVNYSKFDMSNQMALSSAPLLISMTTLETERAP